MVYSLRVNAEPALNSNQPVEITQIGRQFLRIRWADAHESNYPLPQLRRLCRCAACRSRGSSDATAPTSASPFRVLGPEPSAEPIQLEQVGNYALGVHWKDGHHSIFAFDSLRQDCPCRTCAAARAATS
jgi:DUF971 family protein